MRFIWLTSLAFVLLVAPVFATGSLSISLNSLDAINAGDSTSLVATVSASGDSVSNVQVSISLPSGLTTSDSTTQTAGTLSAGQSTTKSWTITGNSAGTYTITVTTTGTSVTTQTANATLTVNSPGFVTVSAQQSPASTLAASAITTLQLLYANTGGSSTTVSTTITPSSGLTVSSGSATQSFDLNAGQSTSISWTFSMTGTGTQTISAAISSTANNPDDLSYSITGPAAAVPDNGGTNPLPPANPTTAPGGETNSPGSSGSSPPLEETGLCTTGETQVCRTGKEGICSIGTQTCSNETWSACVQKNQPRTEDCFNTIDDDCDGAADANDSDCDTTPGRTDDTGPSADLITPPPSEPGFPIEVALGGLALIVLVGAGYLYYKNQKLIKPPQGKNRMVLKSKPE
ncbi:MAG: hypothetical protein J4215_02805 [Candidatus Diapherotrites archaeon]|uniref:Big-1 domain-containing protein n=1 Tax=Candidatus Iainarchaeum sp. TaxID=3101447 RepID=A0A8T4LF20_9ARCH|nr:hypothetical protein [Candidatus Diapherotrites archaeon]